MTRSNSISAKLVEEMKTWRQDFHRHPETAFEENRTAGIVADLLEQWGLSVTRGVGDTGVVATLSKGKGASTEAGGRSILLRADMDALNIEEATSHEYPSTHNGKMHACGHDGHTSMLLGAAKHLAEHADFDGTVVFMFQPAEENGEGALAMLNDDLLKRFPVQEAYALHNIPGMKTGSFASNTGSIMAAEDNFEIKLTGIGSHAAMPHRGRDPLVVGAEVVMAMQSLVARTVDPLQNAVVSFTEFNTNGTVNVIPGEVILKGDTRSLLPEVQDHIENTMKRICQGIADAHGIECDFSYRRNFTPTINTPEQAMQALAVAQSVSGQSNTETDCAPLMGSEDFGYVLEQVPGAYLFLGNGTDGANGMSLHNPAYDFNDEILETGARFFVELVHARLD